MGVWRDSAGSKFAWDWDSMITLEKQGFKRFFLASLLLLIPCAAGAILNALHVQPLGFVLFSVYASIVIIPYDVYMPGKGVVISLVQWTVMIFSAIYVSRFSSGKKFMIIFIAFGLVSTAVAHILMNAAGYNFYIDAP